MTDQATTTPDHDNSDAFGPALDQLGDAARAAIAEENLTATRYQLEQVTAERDDLRDRIATLTQIAQEAAQIIEDIAAGRADDRLGNPNHPYPRWIRARHLAQQAGIAATAPASVPSPRAQEQRQPFDPDARLDAARVWLADADTDGERAEVIADLMRDWLAAWPEGAVTDPYEVLAGELVRLLGTPAEADAGSGS